MHVLRKKYREVAGPHREPGFVGHVLIKQDVALRQQLLMNDVVAVVRRYADKLGTADQKLDRKSVV